MADVNNIYNGDKIASRTANMCMLGSVRPYIPFGIVPDIVVNPHSVLYPRQSMGTGPLTPMVRQPPRCRENELFVSDELDQIMNGMITLLNIKKLKYCSL